jgi:exopolyphosphatase/guanosine-5'-triphosphate,3'-diphosphate pyrophosphatase
VRVAALDLGSNSFHLLVADVHPDGHISPVTQEKEMLRLGDAVSAHGRIGPLLADRAIDTVRRLAGVAAGAGAVEVLAKATSAIRSAADGSDLVDRIERETGVHVEVIDGLEEARLIFEAVRAAIVIDPAPALCLDLGGGSLEVMVGDASALRYAESVHLGVGRLTAEFVRSDPLAKADRKAMDRHVRDVLAPIAQCTATFTPRMWIGSSGTLSDLVAMARAHHGDVVGSRNHLSATAEELRALVDVVVRADAARRRSLPELEEKRVELVPAGAVLLGAAIDLFGIEELTVCDWALREGIVLDAVGANPGAYADDPRAIRRAAVEALARRCGSDEDHTAQVGRLALALFDRLRPLHDLSSADRELLEYAARLHDIGQHVSRKSHHKHAAYLVQHAQLRGFTPDEVAMLAALLRHHRHGIPKPSEPLLGALDPPARDRVLRLAALLRLADGLDRGRRARVDAVDAQTSGDLVLLRVAAHGDPELELWGARRRRELFEEVFGREVEIVRAGSDHD